MAEQKLKSEKNEFLFLYHFRKVFEAGVKIAGVKPGDAVLDFGCGNQNLRPFIIKDSVRGCYTGYDVNPAYSDIPNLLEVRGDVNIVFACSVFEHLTIDELRQAFRDIRATGASRLVVSLPADNLLNRFICWLRKDDELTFWYHLTPSKTVVRELYKAFGSPYKCKRVDGIKYIAGFQIRGAGE